MPRNVTHNSELGPCIVGIELRNASVQIGMLMRTIRHAAGMTQKELSQKMNVDQAVIARIEGGRSRLGPTISTIAAIAAACGTQLQIVTQQCERPLQSTKSASKMSAPLA